MVTGFLEGGTDYSNGDQLTPANLNAHVNSAKPIKAGAAVTPTGNTTDESTCDIDGSGQVKVKDGGVGTTQLADSAVSTAKVADDAITQAKMADASVGNAQLTPTAGSAAVSGSGTGATGTNVIETGSIGAGDLNDDIISGQTETTDAPANTDELLLSDAGTVKRIDVSDFAKHPAFVQAYGVAGYDGATSISGGYNTTSASDSGTFELTITLAITMANTAYVVTANHSTTNSTTSTVTVKDKTTTTFKLVTNSLSKGSGENIEFAVHGTRA